MKLFDTVTNELIKQLENGVAPWVKPWHSLNFQPKNILSKKPYNGINFLILSWLGAKYDSNYWLTFNQAKQLGGSVKRGSKAVPIVFFARKIEKGTDKQGNEIERVRGIFREYYVFNACQCENITIPASEELKPLHDGKHVETIESFVKNTQANIVNKDKARAYFSPSEDLINMPELKQFTSVEDYYSTLFHELTHWTGAENRLNRLEKAFFGSHSYAKEELVAELGSAFLCNQFQLDGKLQHASYLDSWLKVLKEDNKAIFKAASLAEKAVKLLNNPESVNTNISKAA
jgi:antirestriction protein ArdC